MPLNPVIAAQLGIPQTQGVVIGQVVAGSPAAKAGLKRLDVITAMDGTLLKSDSALAQVVNQHQPGDAVTLTVLRGNEKLSVQVTLGEAPAPWAAGAAIPKPSGN